ncbi:hypothetical protein ACOSQ3_015207 [Xanthoceras sorbifolium]
MDLTELEDLCEALTLDETRDCVGNYLRVRVRINPNQALKCGLRVDLDNSGHTCIVVLRYERLPEYCFTCCILGHGFREYAWRPQSEEISAETTHTFGIWLRAMSPRRPQPIRDRRNTAAGDDRSLITMATTESVAEEDTMQAAVGVQASKSVTVAKVGRVIEIEGIALHDVEVMGECQSIGIEAGSSGFHRAQWKRKVEQVHPRGVLGFQCAWLKTKLALGVVIRNGSGEVMLSASRTIDAGLEPSLAKAMAMLIGMKLAVEAGLLPTVVESDSLSIVNLIFAGLSIRSEIGLINNDILNLKTMGVFPSFVFSPKDSNRVAHNLAKMAIVHAIDVVLIDDVPPDIRSLV